jgi:benzoylformate decarboxylase
LNRPPGPVFISLPGDILNAEAAIDLGRATRIDARVAPSRDAVAALADRILSAERPVIIVGDEIVKSGTRRGSPRSPRSSDVRSIFRAPVFYVRLAARPAPDQQDAGSPRFADRARIRSRPNVCL